jgi:AraC-like DNA-binding protein
MTTTSHEQTIAALREPADALSGTVGAAGRTGTRRRWGQLPATVVVLGAPRDWHAELRATLGRLVQLRFVSSEPECAEILHTTASVAVVLTIPGPQRSSAVEALTRLRAAFPQTPFVAFYIATYSDLGALAQVAAGDVRHVLVSERIHHLDHCYLTLAASDSWSTAARVWAKAAVRTDDFVSTLMNAALRLAWHPVSLPRLAMAARMHERTLRKQCDRYGVPSPQWLIGWARCLVAAYYLEEPGRPVQRIAELLHFNSAVLLANHLKRYTGHTATELRRLGAVETTARRFETFLREHSRREGQRDAPLIESNAAAREVFRD